MNENREESSSTISSRKAKREAKRDTGRSRNLRRKAPESEKTEEVPQSEPTKKPAIKKRRRTADRSQKPKVSEKPDIKDHETSAKKGRALPKRTSKAYNEDDYNLINLQDGTSRRVRKSASLAATKKPRTRKIVAGGGPGPVIGDITKKETQRPEKRVDVSFLISSTKRSVTYLKKRLKVKPKVAIILGSGLSSVAHMVKDDSPLSFADIPKFIQPSIEGHSGLIHSGTIGGTPCLICDGRLHYYETGSMDESLYPLKVILALGVERLILTTSAGALNNEYKTGDMMLVTDHLNFMGDNPFFGEKADEKISPFIDCDDIYDKKLEEIWNRICRRARIKTHAGVLAATRGPVYETPAEKKMLHTLGASAVCMSVIPEALLAVKCGVSVAAIAAISNDTSQSNLTHEDVVMAGKKNSTTLRRLITAIMSGRK